MSTLLVTNANNIMIYSPNTQDFDEIESKIKQMIGADFSIKNAGLELPAAVVLSA